MMKFTLLFALIGVFLGLFIGIVGFGSGISGMVPCALLGAYLGRQIDKSARAR